MSAVSNSEPPSPSMFGRVVFERSSMEVTVDASFSWAELKIFLLSYLEAIEEASLEEDNTSTQFYKKLDAWLKNPESEKADPIASLEFWQKSVEEICDSVSTEHFPEIEIIRS